MKSFFFKLNNLTKDTVITIMNSIIGIQIVVLIIIISIHFYN